MPPLHIRHAARQLPAMLELPDELWVAILILRILYVTSFVQRGDALLHREASFVFRMMSIVRTLETNECIFNGMIDLASTSRKYRLGVGGMAFILPGRIRPTLRPLGPVIEGNMALIGTRQRSSKKPDAISSMLTPFALVAWVSLLVCALILTELWLMIVYRST